MEIDKDTEENVARGAALLDEKVPGWARTVQGAMTEGYFEICDWEHCVAGTLEMVWGTGSGRTIQFNGTSIAAYGREAVEYGFVTQFDDWGELDAAWRAEVAKRTAT